MFKCVFHNLVYQFIFFNIFLTKLNTKTNFLLKSNQFRFRIIMLTI